MPGLGDEPLGPDGIVRVAGRLPVELEAAGNDAPGDPGISERVRLVHRLPIDGMVHGQAHPPIVPRRLRVPLLGEVDPVCGLTDVGLQRQPGGSPDLLGHRAANVIGDVHLTALQRGQACGLVRDRLQDQPLHVRGLAPVLIEGFDDELDTRREGHETIGARPDRHLLETLVADLLDVLLRHDPTGPGGAGVEGHEVGPRPLEAEAHTRRIRSLDRRHALLERPGGRAPVTLERELDVLGGDRIAVVEPGAAPEDELVDETVGRHIPRLGQSGRHGVARQGLHHRVVQRVEHHERRDDPGGLGRVEPRGRQRDVHGPGQLTLGRGGGRRGPDRQDREDEPRSDAASNVSHRSTPHGSPRAAAMPRAGVLSGWVTAGPSSSTCGPTCLSLGSR